MTNADSGNARGALADNIDPADSFFSGNTQVVPDISRQIIKSDHAIGLFAVASPQCLGNAAWTIINLFFQEEVIVTAIDIARKDLVGFWFYFHQLAIGNGSHLRQRIGACKPDH